MARTIITLSLVLGLAGCSGGTIDLNPLNWFSAPGQSDYVALAPKGGYEKDTDRRLTIDRVTSLRIERTTAGAIVHATGLPPRLGYWDGELQPENDGKPVKGVVSYRFRIATPRWATNAATPYARTVQVAAFLSNAELKDVRAIRVIGANNVLTARR